MNSTIDAQPKPPADAEAIRLSPLANLAFCGLLALRPEYFDRVWDALAALFAKRCEEWGGTRR